MRLKRYTHGLTFFITTEMFEALKKISDEKEISMSELLREVLDQYICQQPQAEGDNENGVG
jgi:hypothetical protein